MYYLNHIITWSKIGRDGRETYLSLNWDLVDSGLSPQYVISSQVFNEWSNNGTTATVGMYFVLGKTGTCICSVKSNQVTSTIQDKTIPSEHY